MKLGKIQQTANGTFKGALSPYCRQAQALAIGGTPRETIELPCVSNISTPTVLQNKLIISKTPND